MCPILVLDLLTYTPVVLIYILFHAFFLFILRAMKYKVNNNKN